MLSGKIIFKARFSDRTAAQEVQRKLERLNYNNRTTPQFELVSNIKLEQNTLVCSVASEIDATRTLMPLVRETALYVDF